MQGFQPERGVVGTLLFRCVIDLTQWHSTGPKPLTSQFGLNDVVALLRVFEGGGECSPIQVRRPTLDSANISWVLVMIYIGT